MGKKRSSPKSSSAPFSVFSAIDRLETDDANASKRRKKSVADSVARSKAARSQNDLFHRLMEARVLLQRAVCADDHPLTEHDGEKNEVITCCDRLVRTMSNARNELVRNDDDDDDGDEEEAMLQSSYESCRKRWREVLDRRHHDLQIHSGTAVRTSKKFRAVDQSFWTQVESTVSHDKMLRISNSNDDDDDANGGSPEPRTRPASDLYRDDKLYQHMLKDFIRATSAGDSGASDLNDWRKANRKKKSKSNGKSVDRKASKGRKIRYTVHPKLTNFTFPIERPMPIIGEDEWFKSLFGGVRRKFTSEGSS